MINAAITLPKSEKIAFPKLMKLNDPAVTCIALMTSRTTGTILFGGDYKPGHYAEDWHKEAFIDFDGSIELNNNKH